MAFAAATLAFAREHSGNASVSVSVWRVQLVSFDRAPGPLAKWHLPCTRFASVIEIEVVENHIKEKISRRKNPTLRPTPCLVGTTHKGTDHHLDRKPEQFTLFLLEM